MNLKRMLLLLALSAAISAVAGPQKVKTSVEKVTLFIDGAQVTRTRQVDLPAGNSTVVFTGLSPSNARPAKRRSNRRSKRRSGSWTG